MKTKEIQKILETMIEKKINDDKRSYPYFINSKRMIFDYLLKPRKAKIVLARIQKMLKYYENFNPIKNGVRKPCQGMCRRYRVTIGDSNTFNFYKLSEVFGSKLCPTKKKQSYKTMFWWSTYTDNGIQRRIEYLNELIVVLQILDKLSQKYAKA
jgi:hypothetical protein